MNSLEILKKEIDNRVVKYGIVGYEIRYLPYLKFNPADFQNPKDVAKRVIILYGLHNASKSLIKKRKVKAWLKNEGLWVNCTDVEKKYLNSIISSQKIKVKFSWAIESAIVLNWALNKSERLPHINEELSIASISGLTKSIPDLNMATNEYIDSAVYRNCEEIFKENIVNEIVTTYFRDLLFSNAPDTSQINRGVSFERHKALNWLRKFGNCRNWEEVDTST